MTFRDRSYGVGDIMTALVQFEAAHDESGATDFLAALPDGPLKQKAAQSLGEMIARGTADYATFAASLAGYVPGTPMADLMAGLQRTDLTPESGARMTIASEVERQVFGGLSKYDSALRAYAAQYPDFRWTLIPMFFIGDRAWALDNIETVLGGGEGDASLGLRGALGQLDVTAKATLAADVRARYSRLPKATQDSLEEDLKDANL